MAFPFNTSNLAVDGRGLFLVQDPDLRSRILPLFSFDPRSPERPRGHGTAFRIDPWSRCATAFHVLEDLFEVDRSGSTISLKPDIRLAALELNQQGYGRLPIPDGAWRPLDASFSYFRIDTPFAQPAGLRNLFELMVLRVRPSAMPDEGTPYLPMDLRRWYPRKGERLMAIGYPDVDAPRSGDENSNRPFRQYLYASLCEIIDIDPADAARARPWPLLRLDANWPGGMSGGPVFNELGHVVGLVSAGFEGEGGATATYFSAWDVPERIYGSIDPSNPGRFLNWGAFDSEGVLVRCGQDKTEVERIGRALGVTDFGIVSVDPVSEEWTRSQAVFGP